MALSHILAVSLLSVGVPLRHVFISNSSDEDVPATKETAHARLCFADVTEAALPQSWQRLQTYPYKVRHSFTQNPAYTAPSFPDLNGDGVPDFFNAMHFDMIGDPRIFWDVAVGSVNNATSVVYKSCQERVLIYEYNPTSERLKPDGLFVDTKKNFADVHGLAFVDIDKDGYLDLYANTGVQKKDGLGSTSGNHAMKLLFWGSKGGQLTGGRMAAKHANLANKDARGRFSYWLDINLDGLLDVLLMNRNTHDPNMNRPGQLLINQGDRSFAPSSISLYAHSAIVHDFDGDGFAEEFVVGFAADCAPTELETRATLPSYRDGREGYGDRRESGACEYHQAGAVAVFKYNMTSGRIDKFVPDDLNSIPKPWEREVQSFATGDFDGDGVSDLAVLRKSFLTIHYSTRRRLGMPYETLSWSVEKCAVKEELPVLRAADLDNNGMLDLIIACGNISEIIVITQSKGKWKMSPFKLPVDENGPPEIMDPEALYTERAVQPGISVVDFNNDGFMDVVVTLPLSGRVHMFQNWLPHQRKDKANGFIAFRLRGRSSNPHAIGATLVLRACNVFSARDGDCDDQLREVSVFGHEADSQGYHDDRIVFGLGTAGMPKSLEVRWPTRSRCVQTIGASELQRRMNTMHKEEITITEPWHC